MDSDPWITLFVLLTVAANVATIGLWALAVAARAGYATERYEQVRDSLGEAGLAIAAIVASTAMAGSLYLSEAAHFRPCTMCWYQRIVMYPLAILLVVATVRRDWKIRPYALTLGIIGPVVSGYHYLIERFPSLERGVSCDPTNLCSVPLFWHLHYITVPMMALSAFLLVDTILLIARPVPISTEEPASMEERYQEELVG
jgi:disulfide bond formation protein DsbB